MQVKKWDQNVFRAKIFPLFIVKFKKLGFSAPLTRFPVSDFSNVLYIYHNMFLNYR